MGPRLISVRLMKSGDLMRYIFFFHLFPERLCTQEVVRLGSLNVVLMMPEVSVELLKSYSVCKGDKERCQREILLTTESLGKIHDVQDEPFSLSSVLHPIQFHDGNGGQGTRRRTG